MTQKLENIKVRAKNSVDNKELINHLNTNFDLIKSWLSPCWEHEEKALLVSAGRSLDRYYNDIKDAQELGYKIFCVKHSLPKLVANGITPDAVIMLDPRPLDGYSTHGIKRQDLYKDIPKEVMFFVASMTNPSVTTHLMSEGFNVIGWHAAVDGIIEVLQERRMSGVLVQDGTSSAIRGVGLLKLLGFRHIELVAYDSDVEEPSPQQKREVNVEGPTKFVQILDGEDTFYTTGELMAQIQDIKHLVKTHYNTNLNLGMWEGGLGSRAFRQEESKQHQVSSGGGFQKGIEVFDFDKLMVQLKDPVKFKMKISGSDGKALTLEDQSVISSILSNLGLDWTKQEVL